MLRLLVDPLAPAPGVLREAARALARGGVVVYPTDTLYGLGADPRNVQAVARIFAIKGRGSTKALPLVACDEDQVRSQVGILTPLAIALARRFWPGPLSLIIGASDSLAAAVHASTGRVAVRVPASPLARELARTAGHPLTATSANRSGAAPAATADEIAGALGQEVDVLLDVKLTLAGEPSTIVDVTGPQPALVRPGAIAWDRVLEFLEQRRRS